MSASDQPPPPYDYVPTKQTPPTLEDVDLEMGSMAVATEPLSDPEPDDFQNRMYLCGMFRSWWTVRGCNKHYTVKLVWGMFYLDWWENGKRQNWEYGSTVLGLRLAIAVPLLVLMYLLWNNGII
ncbi:hypothetical protein ACHAPU_004933 [Fusarium lateritium]